jgi:cytochrome o ubiquinol oxidase operon protein cyoD
MKTTITEQGSLELYVAGFILSIALTVGAYLLVVNHILASSMTLPVIIGLALVQFWVQLIFFLHLGRESKPRWKVLVFLFTGLIVVILVFGTLWIMKNLNYHAMTDTEILHDEGVSL